MALTFCVGVAALGDLLVHPPLGESLEIEEVELDLYAVRIDGVEHRANAAIADRRSLDLVGVHLTCTLRDPPEAQPRTPDDRGRCGQDRNLLPSMVSNRFRSMPRAPTLTIDR